MIEEQEHLNIPNTDSTKITGMYKDWFLDYASYVILERAVPAIEDGLKPVQRRILHSMKDLDDGRYNKVANIVGHTMQYHPHGDASIADAMVQIGQKDLLIDTQGNWGNILTGDRAAAARYIEARLSKFAMDVVYSPKVTQWQLSYDGRKKEPVNLPVKFPLLLTQGAEGIAVGLSTKILPHNFNEVIDACIKYLKGRSFELYPDFMTGGELDISNYNDGVRGGKVRVRAKLNIVDKTTLSITSVPFNSNTTGLIDSIIRANEKGKIKIKKIEDNTASEVEILVHLPTGISPDKTIDALYAFTDCEVSISPLGCIIEDNKPLFIGVSEMLRRSTDHTVDILKAELEVQLYELQEQWHFASLERIFIEHKIYRKIEDEDTWEGVILAITIGLEPYIKHLKRDITEEDVIRLTEIKIKRISKFDIDKAQQKIEVLEGNIEEVKNHLAHIIDYAIMHYTMLKKKYGKSKERQALIKVFDDIEAAKVVMKNAKLYVNKSEGFVGMGLRKDEYVCECSDIDDIIVFTKKGNMIITKISDKTFVEKDILYAGIFKKKDKRTVYNVIYKDGKGGASYIKRFHVSSITRDKIYPISQGKPMSELLYFSANPNGEAEIVTVFLREVGSVKKLKWNVDFSETLIKSRTSKGNIISKHNVKRVELKEKGVSTLKPRDIWYDEIVQRLNTEGQGSFLGSFRGEDKILVIDKKGVLKLMTPELIMHFEDLFIIQKWEQERPISIIYYDGSRAKYYVKRFVIDDKTKEELIISEHPKSKLEFVSTAQYPRVVATYNKGAKASKNTEEFRLQEMVSVKGIKTLGNTFSDHRIRKLDDTTVIDEEQTN